jgi:PAS domain S-box-containing protein
MTLRRKVVTTLVLTLATLVTIFLAVTGFAIDRTYVASDTSNAATLVLQARSSVDSAVTTLGNSCSDWAYWDDTYAFARHPGAAYIASNLNVTSIRNAGIDAMLFVDAKGSVLFGKQVDASGTTLTSIDPTIVRAFAPTSPLFASVLSGTEPGGLLLVGSQPVVIAARRILTSAFTGPPAGVLVFARTLSPTVITALNPLLGTTLRIEPVAAVAPSTPAAAALVRLESGSRPVGRLIDNATAAGFLTMNDITGARSVLLTITSPRTRLAEAARFKGLLALSSLLMGLAVLGVMLQLLDRVVLSRVASLGGQVENVGATHDLSKRVSLPGSDELSRLAATVNQTLDSLAQSQRERDRLTGELERDQRRVRYYFDNAHDLIFALDNSGLLTLVNATCCKVLGYDEHDLLGRPVMDLVAPESRGFVERAVAQIHNGETVPVTTVDIITREGQRLTLDLSGQRLREDGRVTGTFHIARDITERLQFEREIQRSQALDSLGSVAAGLAHDFNNVLTVVKGNLSLAQSCIEDPEAVNEHCDAAERALGRAQALATQLLTFSRGGAPVKEAVDVAALVRDVIQFGLSGSAVLAVTDIDGDLPSVDADRNQLFQVVQNVVLNAREAMHDTGTVRVTLQTRRVDQEHPFGTAIPGNYVALEIADSGPGITPQDMKRIFVPFFSTKKSGHGLGLATVRSIVRRHSGDVVLTSVPGQGTTVCVCLPAGPVAEKTASEMRTAAPVLTSHGRLLVMDDEPAVAGVACAMARRLGYDATAVENGEAAVSAYAEAAGRGQPYDVVIMDLTVAGGMGGSEATRRLRERYPNAHVVASSGYSDDACIADYAARGFDGALAKPYSLEDLARVLSAMGNLTLQ